MLDLITDRMNLKRIFTTIWLLIIGLGVHAQQGINYTNYGINVSPINTAGSFLRQDGELNFTGRQQWVGLEGAPVTYRLSGSLPIGGKGLMAGINLKHEKVAIEKTNEVLAFVGKSIQLNHSNYLAVSVGAGVSFYNGSFSDLDSQDPAFVHDLRETEGLVAVSAMFYQPEKYYVGISAPKVSFSKLGISSSDLKINPYNQYHFTAGYLISLTKDFDVKPATLLTWSKDVDLQADFSAILFLKKTFGLGLNVRTYGDMAGMAQFILKKVNIGYSYQFNTQTQPLKRSMNNNTHEISLAYRFGKGMPLF